MKTVYNVLSKALKGFVSLGEKKAEKNTAPDIPNADYDYISEAKSEYYTAGFGKEILMPDDIEKRKYYIAGYSANNPAKGVIDPQYASALWLDDNSGRGGLLFIALDVVGILNKDVNRLKAHLADFKKLTGCRDIKVMATHNHAGIDTMGLWGPLPLSGKNEKFINIVFEGAKRAAFSAYYDRRNGRLFYGRTEVPDMQEDIRTPEVYSKYLTRLRFSPSDGSKDIYFINFASHCESLQGSNSLVSSDFPCYLRETIKEKTGADTVFTVGAIGGMISMKVDDENLLRSEHRLLESTRNIGKRLAGFAAAVENERELKPLVNNITQEFYCPVDNPMLAAAGQLGIIAVDRYSRKGSSGIATIKTQLSYMEIDDIKLLFLPCELFPELAYGGYLPASLSATGKGPEINPEPLAQTIGDGELIIFGLADDEIGYVIPPNDFYLHPEKPYLDKGIDRHGRRHYEETNSAGPKTAEIISETLKKVLSAVADKKGIKENEE